MEPTSFARRPAELAPYGPRWHDTAVPSRQLIPSDAHIHNMHTPSHSATCRKSGDLSPQSIDPQLSPSFHAWLPPRND